MDGEWLEDGQRIDRKWIDDGWRKAPIRRGDKGMLLYTRHLWPDCIILLQLYHGVYSVVY